MELIKFSENKLDVYFAKIDSAITPQEIVEIFQAFIQQYYPNQFSPIVDQIDNSVHAIDITNKEYLKFAMRVYLMPAEYGFSSIDAINSNFPHYSFFNPKVVKTVAYYFSNLIIEKIDYLEKVQKIFIEASELKEDFSNTKELIDWIISRLTQFNHLDIKKTTLELKDLLRGRDTTNFSLFIALQKILRVSFSDFYDEIIKSLPYCGMLSHGGRIQTLGTISNLRESLGLDLLEPDLDFSRKIKTQAQRDGIQPMSLGPLFKVVTN